MSTGKPFKLYKHFPTERIGSVTRVVSYKQKK